MASYGFTLCWTCTVEGANVHKLIVSKIDIKLFCDNKRKC